MFDITGKTKQLGIIGDPVEHSFSPKMHNFISERIGADYVYSAFHVKGDNLKEAIDGVRALNISGINVTAPHKIEVMQYLDEISDDAKYLGSVNTVVNKNGRLCGYNTDSEGFYMSLLRNGIEVVGKNILIIGAGGVVKPTLLRLIKANPASVTVLNRTKARAQELADAIYAQTGYKVKTEADNLRFDVVINTTSAGMEPQEDKLPIDEIEGIDSLDFVNEKTAVVDMIYNPDKTLFLRESEKRGAKVLNGLYMLIYQGIIAYELFTGLKLDDDIAEIIKKEVFGR